MSTVVALVYVSQWHRRIWMGGADAGVAVMVCMPMAADAGVAVMVCMPMAADAGVAMMVCTPMAAADDDAGHGVYADGCC
jgi:hypothetical protein